MAGEGQNRRVAFITSSRFSTKITRYHISDLCGAEVVVVDDFADAREALQQRFGVVVIDASKLSAGDPDLSGLAKIDYTREYPEYVGKKVLTEIVRAEGSVNIDTPVVVFSVGCESEVEGYSTKDYVAAGANHVLPRVCDPRTYVGIITKELDDQ
jgi:hypothetical protein